MSLDAAIDIAEARGMDVVAVDEKDKVVACKLVASWSFHDRRESEAGAHDRRRSSEGRAAVGSIGSAAGRREPL